MINKEKIAEIINHKIHLFKCPICYSPMNIFDQKSIVCLKNHTFDIAKKGYVNMLNQSINSRYSKELFMARHKMIVEKQFFERLHQKVSEMIMKEMNAVNEEIIVLDAGCGEGSHLQIIVNKSSQLVCRGIGLDIAKEGIRKAASHYKESIWLVGDIAKLPLANQSCHVILNILSPANYKEFKRILVPGGLVIKVVPRLNYLKELREVLIAHPDKKSYKNDKIVPLFEQHFDLVDIIHIQDTKEVSQEWINDLLHMTPLAWNYRPHSLEQIKNKRISQVSIDLDVLVGKVLTKGERE